MDHVAMKVGGSFFFEVRTHIPINGSHVFRSILVPTTPPAVVFSSIFTRKEDVLPSYHY
jgi:hypothetical protein